LESDREDGSPADLDEWRQQLESGNFFAEGEQVVIRLLHSSIKIISLLVTPEFFNRHQEIINAHPCRVAIAKKTYMEQISGRALNQGAIALAKIPQVPPLYQTLEKNCGCLVALDGIAHAVNVGSILRNCAAFDVAAVLTDHRSTHPYAWRAVKASIGGVFGLNIYHEEALHEALARMREQFGFTLVAADPHGALQLNQLEFPRQSCLIFGGEHSGISEEILNLKPLRVRIPLSEKIDSLNVAATSAIFLAAVASQRSSFLAITRTERPIK
jgi:tRNA G18 (ribose-2'-O)-methylase SpoU